MPTLDGVAFIDPRASQVDIVQAVGRAIRKAPDKKIGTVILPVFVESGEDVTAVLDDSAFKPVWSVLKALRSHDDALGEELDQLRRELGRRSRKRITPPKKIVIELPLTVGKAFAESFKVKIVEQTTASWEYLYGMLESFIRRNGHCRVLPRYVTDEGIALGSWVSVQRQFRRRGLLLPPRQRLLERLPGWAWEPREADWLESFAELREYVGVHGHARVPPAHITENGLTLGTWVANQRHRKGRLSSERRVALQRLPGWVWNVQEAAWQEGFEHLLEYVQEEGNALVPGRHVSQDEYALGTWINSLRQGKVSLDIEKRRALERLPGWTWNAIETSWQKGFAELKGFVAEMGHTFVPQGHITKNDYALGNWVSTQRQSYRSGELSAERQRALDSLSSWTWEPYKSVWSEGFDRLRSYTEREGHALVPASHVTKDGYKLGHWVNRRRNEHKRKKLFAERQEALEQLPGWEWNVLAASWQEAYGRLCQYARQNGNAIPSSDYVTEDDFRLGAWVNKQRQAYRQGSLAHKRKTALDRLPGWRWNPLIGSVPNESLWQRRLAMLRDYALREGHCRVSRSSPRKKHCTLARWIETQRRTYRQGNLSTERQRALEQLRGWAWDASRNRK